MRIAGLKELQVSLKTLFVPSSPVIWTEFFVQPRSEKQNPKVAAVHW